MVVSWPKFGRNWLKWRFQVLIQKTRETAIFRPSFTETVNKKKMGGFPLKPLRMLVTIFFSYISKHIHNLYTHKVWRNLKDTFRDRPTRPTRPIKLGASRLAVRVNTGPRRDIVVAQSTQMLALSKIKKRKNIPSKFFKKTCI